MFAGDHWALVTAMNSFQLAFQPLLLPEFKQADPGVGGAEHQRPNGTFNHRGDNAAVATGPTRRRAEYADERLPTATNQ